MMTNTPTVFDAVPIPGFTPANSLYGFGARTGGETNEHRVINILFVVQSAHKGRRHVSLSLSADASERITTVCDTCP